MKGLLSRGISRYGEELTVSTDAYPNNTTLLVRFYGNNGDSSGPAIQDESWNNWVPSQAVSETDTCALTTTAKKFAPTSLDQSYTTNYGVATRYSGINYAVPTGTTATNAATVVDMSKDFTIEGWVYYISLPSVGYQNYFFSSDTPNNFTYNAAVNGIRLGARDNGELIFYIDNGTDLGPPAQGTAGSVKFTAGQWQHWAIVKSNNTMGAFINGTAATGSWLVATGARTHSQGFGYARIGTDVQKAGTPIYIDSVRVTSGVARYTPGSNFTIDSSSRFPAVRDPYRANVTTHLRFENNATDVSQNAVAWSVSGTPTYNSTQRAFGTYSFTPASGSYYSAATNAGFGMGTGDFTVEAWVYRTGANTYNTIWDSRISLSDANGFILMLSNTGALQFWTATTSRISGGTLSTNQWYHVAVSRVSGNTRLFLNGVQTGTTYADTTDYGTTKPGQIGNTSYISAVFAGSIDELRVTKGVGRYSATFTPPTAPFPGA